MFVRKLGVLRRKFKMACRAMWSNFQFPHHTLLSPLMPLTLTIPVQQADETMSSDTDQDFLLLTRLGKVLRESVCVREYRSGGRWVQGYMVQIEATLLGQAVCTLEVFQD